MIKQSIINPFKEKISINTFIANKGRNKLDIRNSIQETLLCQGKSRVETRRQS